MTATDTAASPRPASRQYPTQSLDATSRASHEACLIRGDIAGPFSLIGQGPVRIDAVPGLAVSVRQGTLAISRIENSTPHVVHAGERFDANRAGPLTIWPLSRTELHLDWPTEAPRAH